jgi:uncharacterized membrane protein
MRRFLTESEEKAITDAIGLAEDKTSGEIRVHIETRCKPAPLDRALEVFYALGMEKTRDKNGVLIYIATDDHKLAILGDEGINKVVPPNFWDAELELMKSHFKQGAFAQGISQAIHDVGEKLKAYFPFQTDDKDELSNDISVGH